MNLEKPFVAECARCGQLLQDWVGSTACCGSVAYVVAENCTIEQYLEPSKKRLVVKIDPAGYPAHVDVKTTMDYLNQFPLAPDQCFTGTTPNLKGGKWFEWEEYKTLMNFKADREGKSRPFPRGSAENVRGKVFITTNDVHCMVPKGRNLSSSGKPLSGYDGCPWDDPKDLTEF
jgi:hypothetical protein